jgi:hypothetical protein
VPPVPFAVQSYRHDSLPISAQRVLNMYAEAQPQGARSQVALLGCPGISTFATAGAGPVRGAHLLGGILYVVSGPWLYSITNAATPVVTQLGGQISGTGVVSMADNGTELVIVNGSNGYIYDTGSGFRLITDTDFDAADTVAFLDSFFTFNRKGTAQWFRSDSLDGTSYNALAFATKESKSDNILAVVNLKQVAYLLGSVSSELWANVGAANFPWQRLPGGTIDRGIIGSYAWAQEDQALFLVGDDRMTYKISGTQLQRISTHAIEQAFQKYTAISDAFGLAYTWNGHKMIAFTFPTQDADLGDTTTWEYDIATGLWHERLSYDINGTPLGRWRGNVAIEAYGKILIGDAFSGKIGYLDPTVETEFDCPMYAQATSPPYHAGDKPLFHSDFTLDVEAGVGRSEPSPADVVEGNDAFTKILLSFDDWDGSTTITDTSSGGASGDWEANGGAAIDTGDHQFGSGSLLCDGTGDFVSTPDHADFTLGSGDFTVDVWFRCDAAGGTVQRLCGHGDNSGLAASHAWDIFRTSGNVIQARVSNGSAFTSVTGTTQFTSAANTGWHHLAFVRTSDVLKLFIDGVQEGSNTAFAATVLDGANALTVGTNIPSGANDGTDWNGGIDEFRLSVGNARWTTTFTPPVGPYKTAAQIAVASAGQNPQAMLDISDDGGRTFGPLQPWAAMGAQGAYKTWVRWDRLGKTERGGTRVYRVTVSDPVKKTIIGAHANMKPGM